MSLVVHLLGRPRIVRTSGEVYAFRSRKSWALLAELLAADIENPALELLLGTGTAELMA